MSDIYEQIWNSDENGFSVSLRDGDSWENPDADILLDVQVAASGRRNMDLATHPLFHQVREEKLELPTYAAFIKLLDNYVTHFREEEILTFEEEKEIQEFLQVILSTKPIRLAREYINDQLGEHYSEEQFRAKLQRIWFELYTNYYKDKATHFCSGFEHVFVGEAKFNANFRSQRDRAANLGEISGYHSWIKFYLDEKLRDVNFLGHKYDLRGRKDPKNPNIVTLQMIWDLTDMHGNVVAQLFKKKGGFFVGPSPECEMAMGAVAYFESFHGKVIQDKRRTTINGANYDLVLYRNITPQGSRGEFIRSFFPILLDAKGKPEPRQLLDDKDRTEVKRIEELIKNDGPVIIVAALPNPHGEEDAGEEWVELQNVTNEAIDLTGWELRDKAARPEPLVGTLEPNETQRFMITRFSAHSMQLGNRPGLISLHNKSAEPDLVAAVRYGRASSGEVMQFERTSNS